MFKQINLGHWIAMAITFCIFVAIASSDKLNYAFDYEFNVLTKDCTYELYVQDKMSCIKPELRD